MPNRTPSRRRDLAQSAWTLPGEIVEEAITTGGASAREAAGRGLVALQDAGNAGSPVQARVTGMENGVPAFQGGTLSGPLGAVNVAEGGGDGLEATASLQPAAGIGVVMQQRPDGAAAGVDVGQALHLGAASEADRRRWAAAVEIARGLSVGAASEGDTRRGTVAWRIAHGTRISGRVGDDGRRGGLDLQLMDRVGVSVDARPSGASNCRSTSCRASRSRPHAP